MEENILETIQEIGAIFWKKNIPSVPISTCYTELQYDKDHETVLLQELILHFEEQLAAYNRLTKQPSKYSRYLEHFKRIFNENMDQQIIVGRGKPSGKQREQTVN